MGTKIGHEPAPAETTWPMTPGATAAPGTHLTTTPRVPIYEVTLVGAFGAEYVLAWAIGTKSEVKNDVVRAKEPQLKSFRFGKVDFIPVFNQMVTVG